LLIFNPIDLVCWRLKLFKEPLLAGSLTKAMAGVKFDHKNTIFFLPDFGCASCVQNESPDSQPPSIALVLQNVSCALSANGTRSDIKKRCPILAFHNRTRSQRLLFQGFEVTIVIHALDKQKQAMASALW